MRGVVAVRRALSSSSASAGLSTRWRAQGNKVFMQSLGCARNWVDSEVMLGQLLQAGYEPTQQIQDADVCVVNTCAFLGSARDESHATIASINAERKHGSKLIVAGCMANLFKDQILEKCPEVDHILGSGAVDRIVGVLKQPTPRDANEKLVSGDTLSYLEQGEVPRQVSTPPHLAYVKIAEGCRKQCSFCIIPQIKGPLRSKTTEQVVREVRALLGAGVREIVFIAQDLGDYGKDRKGERRSDNLSQLLREVLASTRERFWLRLLYLYPDEITPELVDVMRSDERVCRYLDMPIQHINNDILKAMKRWTSREDIHATLSRLRTALPDITIRTTLMVGFPGETEAHFAELLDFVRTTQLDHVGVFAYSNEAGTVASRLGDHVEETVKTSRRRKVSVLQSRLVAARSKRVLGRVRRVIVDGSRVCRDGRQRTVARHQGQCMEVDSVCVVHEVEPGVGAVQPGAFYKALVVGTDGNDLLVRLLAKDDGPEPPCEGNKAE